jgi:hypothetical protein
MKFDAAALTPQLIADDDDGLCFARLSLSVE